ncbi:unnamed protein product, partial [Mesorhabditis belari]|uniref:SSD domain-containing protein n=1 Tax=Mesorhabditis belari TaxID=2138241 RepID=A0AAF3FMB3_9BILA
MLSCTQKFETKLTKSLYHLGYSLGKHPWRYIITILFFTAISTIGVLRFCQWNNPRETFTDSDSPSSRERTVIREFLGVQGNVHFVDVLIKAADNGSLIRHDQLEDLNRFLNDSTSYVHIRSDDLNLTYNEMCSPYCAKLTPLQTLIEIFLKDLDVVRTYPKFELGDQQLYVGDSVYDVTLNESTQEIQSIGAVVVHFMLTHPTKEPMFEWENELLKILDLGLYPSLSIGASSDELIRKEVQMMGNKSSIGLLGALIILVSFMIICSLRYDLRESKWWESLFGAGIPVLVMAVTVGLISATGYPFQSIAVAVMFLILAIGIDDVFLMIAAWHRTDKKLPIAERTARMVESSGSSMTVTSVTNFISFGNGLLSTTPVLQCFAIYATVASVIGFAFQIILFPCVLALGAYKETRIDDQKASCAHFPPARVLGRWRIAFCKLIAQAATNGFVQIATIFLMIAYWAMATYGLTLMETELAIQHLAPKESPLVRMRIEFDETVKQMQTMAIVVKKPGDLREKSRLKRLNDMVREFEVTPHAYGNSSTIYWIREMMDQEDQFDYSSLVDFIDDTPQWTALVKINHTACEEEESACVREFMFTTGFTDYVKYNDVYKLITEWRKITAKYSEFDAYAYTERSDFSDSAATLISTIWWTILSEVICMIIAFIFFIPNIHSIIAATFALFSVNLGVLGFLNLWGVGVDPFSLASLLMSVGFSVDICAHVSYHYYQMKHQSPQKRIEHTLLDVGWATTQGALSTLLAMAPTVFFDSYLLLVFFKTVILVNTFGIIHGLFILPVLLGILSRFQKPKELRRGIQDVSAISDKF